MKGIKFSKNIDTEFSRTINQRVNTYFNENQLSRKANHAMILKSLVIFSVFVLTYATIIFGNISNLPILFFLWAMLGLGQSLIGMSIMHDTLHGSYTKNKFANLLLQLPVMLIGVEPKIWKIEHNIIHHTYTNVEGVDQDIDSRHVFRFTANQPKKWFHAYQHIYSTFIYGLLIIEWMTIKDILKTIKYYRMRYLKSRKEMFFLILSITVKKSIFYILFLIIPLKLLAFPSIVIFGMFITMLVVAGILLTIIFQLAHVVPKSEVESNIENLSNKNWHIHQMHTTSNFAHGNKIITYLVGGLNYQIEHHLFPNICHVHYPAISGIVKQTAEEFNIPYNIENTFFGAIKSHYRLLKGFGTNDIINK
jgi:linoleoyl-CoA desaturase